MNGVGGTCNTSVTEMNTQFQLKNFKEGDHLENVIVDGMITN
jgi:hypothetical protein